MSDAGIWTIIVGMGVVNFAIRFTPLVVLSKIRLGGAEERFLSFIPVSVMAALVAGEVLHPGGAWPVPWRNPYLFAAVPTGYIFYRTRSFIFATLAGIGMFLVITRLVS